MSLEHREEHGEDGESAHVNERPNCLNTPGTSRAGGGGCRVRGDLPSPATELIAEAVIDAYEQTHYYSCARKYSLQAHHWKGKEEKSLSS